MKLKDYKFEDENDLKMFKYFKRTLKDIKFVGFKVPLKSIHIKNNDIIKRCYDSRHGHSGEGRSTNCGYWLGDTGYDSVATDVIRFIWQLRVIDTFGICPHVKSNARSRFSTVMSKIMSEEEKITLYSNLDLIKKYLPNIFPEICDKENNMIDSVINSLFVDKSGLPM